MITNFISFRVILEGLYRDLNLNTELNENDVISWIAEGLNLIGAAAQYEEISECLTVTNGKAKLPCGLHKLSDVRYKHSPMYWSSNSNASNYQCHNCRIPVCEAGTCDGYTFYINDSYIITNINDHDDLEANLCMVYLGIRTDEEGFPLIPDDPYYQKALKAYVTERLDYQDWRRGKLSDKVYEDSKFQWGYYVNSAKASANMPNLAQLESLKNILLRLKSNPNAYRTAFKGLNKPENLNLRQY